MSKSKDSNSVEKKESFLEKMKSDKKYNAKVQLVGYGVFLVALVIYLNISSIGSSVPSGNIIFGNDNGGSSEGENALKEDANLLENLDDNYSYDIVISVDKKSMNTETLEEVEVNNSIRYFGKSYGNKLEINKTVTEVTDLYYKVDDNYYSNVNNITSLVKEAQVYNIINSEYIELADILKLLEKASLDHITEYSNGKKESVYHLLVTDLIVEYKDSDVIEINVVEENNVLKIGIDYSNLFSVIDESIGSCEVDVTITDIGKIEDFEVVVSQEENASRE